MHVVKRRRNWHRHDYSEINDGKKVSEVIATVGGGGGGRKRRGVRGGKRRGVRGGRERGGGVTC